VSALGSGPDLLVEGATVLVVGGLGAAWGGGALLRSAGRRRSAPGWAVATVVLGTASWLGPQLGPRTFTQDGAVTAVSAGVELAARLAAFAAVGTALLTLAAARSQRDGDARASRPVAFGVLGVYAMGLAKTLGGLFVVGSPVTDLHPLYFALMLHAVARGAGVARGPVLGVSRGVARSVTVGSLALAVAAPSWAYMPDTARFFGVDRLAGLTPHPNTLAVIAGAALVLEWLPPVGRGRWVGTAAALAALAASQSTTGVVVGAVIALALLFGNHPRHRLALLAGTTFVVVVTALGSDVVAWVLGGVGADRLDTVSGRTIIWSYAWAAFRAHPLLGMGSQFLSDAYRANYLPAVEQQAVHAHNQVLQTLGESGLVGAAGLAMLLAALGYAAWVSRRRDGWSRLTGLVWLVGFGVTEVPLRAVGVSGLAALLVVPVLLVPDRGAREESATPPAGASRPAGRAPTAPSGRRADDAVPVA